MKHKLIVSLAFYVTLFLGVIVCFVGWVRNSLPDYGDPADCRYAKAELVDAVVSGQTGQVTGVSNLDGECWYYVRFAVPQAHTAGGFLFSGGPVRQEPLTTIRMEEFELRPAQ